MTAQLDPEIRPIDDLLDAWARDGRQGQGGGMHPLERLRLLHDGVVLGAAQLSNDEILILVDQAYLSATPPHKALVDVWYKSSTPIVVKARRLGISRETIYKKHREALAYFRGYLHARGLRI